MKKIAILHNDDVFTLGLIQFLKSCDEYYLTFTGKSTEALSLYDKDGDIINYCFIESSLYSDILGKNMAKHDKTFSNYQIVLYGYNVRQEFPNIIGGNVQGCISKNCKTSDVIQLLKRLDRKEYYLDGLSMTKLLEIINNKHKIIALSPKEIEFVTNICDYTDSSYGHIAEIMGVSRRTIDGYRDSVFRKLNVMSRVGVVVFAIKNNLIKLND